MDGFWTELRINPMIQYIVVCELRLTEDEEGIGAQEAKNALDGKKKNKIDTIGDSLASHQDVLFIECFVAA